tara:strand:+ start:168 stop:641 length:474 start_codon:yes stop_codon:yes gene_type:complete
LKEPPFFLYDGAMNKKTDEGISLFGIAEVIVYPIILILILLLTAEGPVLFTELFSFGLMIFLAYFLGRVRGSKDGRKYYTDDFLNTKTGLRYDEIELDTKKKGIATVGDLVNIQVKDDKRILYGLITTFVIYLLLVWFDLWHKLLNWLGDLFGVWIL